MVATATRTPITQACGALSLPPLRTHPLHFSAPPPSPSHTLQTRAAARVNVVPANAAVLAAAVGRTVAAIWRSMRLQHKRQLLASSHSRAGSLWGSQCLIASKRGAAWMPWPRRMLKPSPRTVQGLCLVLLSSRSRSWWLPLGPWTLLATNTSWRLCTCSSKACPWQTCTRMPSGRRTWKGHRGCTPPNCTHPPHPHQEWESQAPARCRT
mmetsp:Transcript_22298/g.61670  ORF Transcript_22298/g.61670 Transcript_22298/m.61670 type:complete len:210 (+) Transcript_22298:309-938(+)